jgi:uncharacterized membrane protein
MHREVTAMKTYTLNAALAMCCLLLAALAGPGQAKDLAVSRQDIDVSGLGHDPDWQLQIMHAGNKVNFTLAGTEYSYHYPATGPSLYREATRTTIYRVPNDEHSLNIILKGVACLDSKTGKAYEITSTVMMDGVGYKGCGDVLNR